MSKVKVGVVEDELIIADNIIECLEELGYETVGPSISYTAALEMISKNKPDILLLDIILAGNKDGIDLAWKIKEEFNIPFIFLTSNADKHTIDRAKLVNPPAYLVKPFSKDELFSAIEIAFYNFVEKPQLDKPEPTIKIDTSNFLLDDVLFIKDKNNYVKVSFEEILFIENDHVYLKIVTDSQEYIVRSNMLEYLSKLPAFFYRIHRSYAINTKHLKSIDTSTITISGYTLPISKSYREELLEKLNLG